MSWLGGAAALKAGLSQLRKHPKVAIALLVLVLVAIIMAALARYQHIKLQNNVLTTQLASVTVAYKNQDKENRALRKENESLKVREFTVTRELPSGEKITVVTRYVDSVVERTITKTEVAKVVLPPKITMKDVALPGRPWTLGLEYWPPDAACQADLSYRLGRFGLGAAVQPAPFGWGVRGSVSF